jgi:hypothetical protein
MLMLQYRSRVMAVAILSATILYPLSVAAQAGPVAAYGFNEGAGATVSDLSGNGNSGTITGATWTPSGKFGSSLTFNGTSNVVTIAHNASLSLGTAMTLEAWVKPSALSSWRCVILKEATNGLTYALYASDTASRPSGYIHTNSDTDVTSSTALALNAWTHLALTYDGATMRLFVNGVQAATRAISGSITTSTSALRIGGNNVWGEYFSGQIDEVRLYNRALSAAEIQSDMSMPVGTSSGSWSVSGTILPATDGTGSTVSLSGPLSKTTTADVDGSFSFTGLADGPYTITPAKSGFSFSPTNLAVTVTGANVGGANFSMSSNPVTDTTPPSVSISAPASGATVANTVSVSASATDDVGVAGVQFQLDGANLGNEAVMPPYTTSWNTTLVANGTHTLRGIARDAAGNKTTAASISVTVSNTVDPATVGQWGGSFDLGIVAVNTVLMHTGKVLMFSGTYETGDTERVWDPVTGSITLVHNPYYNLFCAGQAQLPDGRILVAGGYDPSSLGAKNANIFDPVSLTWSALPNMAYRRWYPSVTALPDGKMLVMSGGTTCLTCLVDVPEVFDPTTNTFTQLTASRYAVPYYPFMYVLPDGRVIDAGANEDAFETKALDLKTGAWSMIDSVVKDGHSSVMYRPGKILKTGTAADSGTVGAATKTAYVLDMTQPSPTWRQIDSMAYARAFQNTTVLPDGNVLVTGGGTTLDGHDLTKSVTFAEMWNPTTEKWQTLSKAAFGRLYHSTSLLLPDGRVLIAGSGNDFGTDLDNRQAELYSPPYLFKGPRPTIGSAPSLIQYGSSFVIQSTDAASIGSIALLRPGAVTHAFDEDQRFVPLTFTVSGTTLTVTAPANANLAPPGYYMLFIVNTTGVPSIASWVHFPALSVDTQPPTAPSNLSAQGGMGSAALAWTGSTDNTGVSVYNIHRSTMSGFAPTATNRIGQVTGTSYTNTGVPAGTYFYVVTAQDIAGNISAPSNESGVTVFADTTAPTVSLTSPAEQATISGTTALAAMANDDVGVAGVLFTMDGVALGAEKVSAPYSMSWNSATSTNGLHTIAAVARDASGNRSSSSATINVSNTMAAPNGLVLALGFNEGSGTIATDASGNGNNGGLVNGAAWSNAGHTGAAISFTANGWVTVTDAASLDLTDGMTLEAWINPTSGTGWRSVMLKEATSALSYALYSANNASRPGVWIRGSGSADEFVLGTAAVPPNAWTHVAAAYDGTTLRFFINGVQVASKASPGPITKSSGPLRIGGNSIWGEYFRGLIDDVRIYNRALTAAEIQTDMTEGIQ